MRRPQPHVQRGIRLAIAVFIACVIGYGVVLPRGGIHDHYERQWVQSFKWCAITCVVVSAPVIGKVAQVGIERVLGTIIGGWTGYAVYMLGSQVWNETTDGIVLSVGAAAVAYISCEAAQRLKLADSAKLFALTFLLVTFGAQDGKSALAVTISRISGICIGVGVSLLISVIVYPSSATVKALACMRQSLTGLVELNAMAWQEPAIHQLPGDIASKLSSSTNPWGYMSLSGKEEAEEWSSNTKARQEHFEAETERILMDTYNSLYKCQEFVPLAKSEIYMGVVKKHLCFFPGLPFGCQFGRWTLPQTEMQTLATCVRRLARLLWTLHLTFQEGFDENMMAMLKQQYPSQLMPQLVQSAQATLQDMLDAFPNEDRVNLHNMRQFATAVAGLLHISDFQRRRITHMMRHYRDMRRKKSTSLASTVVQHFKQNAASSRASRLSETSGALRHGNGSYGSQPGSPESFSSTASAALLGQDGSEHQPGSGGDVVVDVPDEKVAQAEPLHPRQHVTQPTGVAETAFAEDPEAEEAAAALQNDPFLTASPGSKAQTLSEIEGDSPPRGKENGPSQNGLTDIQSHPTLRAPAGNGLSVAGLTRSQSADVRDPRQNQHQGLAALLDSPDAAPRAAPYALRRELLASKANALSQREPSLAHLAASNLADQSINHAVAAARQQSHSHSARGKADTRADEAFNLQRDVAAAASKSEQFTGFTPSSAGNLSHMASPFSQHAMDPTDAFAHLPAGLRIQLQAPGAEDMSRASSLVYHQQGDEQSGMSISLPRVNSAELLLFPETAEGHVSKVRWYSFQFLMEELAEEFQEMHVALTALLIKLPDGVIKLT